MRTITNKLNLPEPIVKAVSRNDYDQGEADFSVTGLLRPPRISVLEEKHKNEIVEDAADRIWSLMGTAIHMVLERAGIPERRFMSQFGKYTVSGQPDRYKDGLLQDYKFVTAWKAKNGEAPVEFVQQVNCYAAILRLNGYRVDRAEVVMILRDWSKLEALRNPDYPRKQTVVIEVPLWSQEECVKFIEERIKLHVDARTELPECSKEERWAKDDVYAVMKKGMKRAAKLLNSWDLAKEFISEQKKPDEYYVMRRPGESVRCSAYCPVAQFCSQWKSIQEEQE